MAFQITVVERRNLFPLIAGMLRDNAADIAHDYTVEDLTPESQRRAPVDWGTLRDTPTVTAVNDHTFLMTFYGGSASGWGGEPRIYAAYQEYGTRFHKAQPYVVPAIDATFPGGVEKRKGRLIDF